MSTRRYLTLAAMAVLPVAAMATPARPLGAQTVRALTGGEIHTLAGEVIANGTVVITDGLITAVGANVAVPAGAEVMDVSGLRVYPGLFDAMTQLGLTEIGQVDVTNDFSELGDFNPHLVAATAVHPASEHIPVARANGVTHAITAPRAGGGGFRGGGSSGFAGQGTLVNLDGWTVEEMQVVASVGLVLQWPTIRTREFDINRFEFVDRDYDEAKKEFEDRLTELRTWFESGKHQVRAAEAGAAARDLKLEALGRVISGDLPLIIVVNGERNIRAAVDFAETEGLDFILAGANEAWKVADMLAEKDVRVILGPTQTMPGDDDESYDEAYANPGKLHAAGVTFAIATFGSSNVRLLPFEAGQAVPFGLPNEEALKAITIYPAQILGLADKVGTIEPGKMANLMVTDGDPLEIRTQVTEVIIGGRPVGVENKHKDSYEKWRSRPTGSGSPGSQRHVREREHSLDGAR